MYRPTADALRALSSAGGGSVLERLGGDVEDTGTTEDRRVEISAKLQPLVAAYKQKRAETRSARIKADAAACALLEHYESREDRFGTQVREFATQIRVIVGRAHNKPLRTPILMPPVRRHSGGAGSAQVAERLDSIAYPFPEPPDDRSPLTESAEITADKNIRGDVADISHYLNETCESIQHARDDTAYAYAMLRLAVNARPEK